MTEWHERLDPAQRAWATTRLPDAHIVQDMSWNLFESIVLHVRTDDGDFVLKAGDATNHHIGREIMAHPVYTETLVDTGHAARMLDAERALHIMLLEYLPGVLVQATDAEQLPDTYAQAGDLLRRLHSQTAREDPEHEKRTIERALSWLDAPHRVDAANAAKTRQILEAAPMPNVTVVPTHGDWQPRNWLIDNGTVRVIDFGRFAFRPAATDLTRLAAQQWRDGPDLEAAFFDGYGADPREPEQWRMDRLKEAIGTACWAFQVGDEEFEAQGQAMLADVLAEF